MRQNPVQWVTEVLGDSEDILIPVRALWLDMQSRGIGTGLTEEAFVAMLEDDEGLQVLVGFDDEADEEERAMLEDLGFYSGRRVKLADRDLPPEYVTRMLRQSTQTMLDALEGAWETRPADDPEAERQLLEVLTMAERLKHEVDSALEEVGDSSS